MIARATLKGNNIFIETDSEGACVIPRLPGASRTKKMPALTWWMPLTFDTINDLRRERIPCSKALALRARAMIASKHFVDAQKAAEIVRAIRKVPINNGFSLFNHQIKAFNIALSLFGYCEDASAQPDSAAVGGSCALFMDMGTGKSLTSVMIAGRLFLDGNVKRVLVVAPSSVCPVWPGEFRKFGAFPARVGVLLGDRDKRLKTLKWIGAPALPGHTEPLRVAVINYESTWRLEDELKAFAPDMIICDESQRIKSPTAQQSKAMHALGKVARYKMILTGTPIQNDTRDFWSQYQFLAPGIFSSSYYAYEKRYAVIGGFGNHQYLGPRNVEELTRKAHSIAYRVTKTECLDLPEKTFERRDVELEDDARRLYRQLKEASIAELDGESVTASIVLTRLLKLQQLTGGFVTDDAGMVKQVSSAKLDAAADIVQSLCVDEGKKIVIFTRFRAELNALKDRLQQVLGSKLKQVMIYGDTKLKDRGDIVKQFQEDENTRVFIGNLDACAEGLTLTAADTILYFSLSFNAAKYQQSQDRIHRIGQRNTCTYLHLVVPKSIDDKIMSALEKKIDLAKTLTDNWRWILEED